MFSNFLYVGVPIRILRYACYVPMYLRVKCVMAIKEEKSDGDVVDDGGRYQISLNKHYYKQDKNRKETTETDIK